jgi:hypothetical protein
MNLLQVESLRALLVRSFIFLDTHAERRQHDLRRIELLQMREQL